MALILIMLKTTTIFVIIVLVYLLYVQRMLMSKMEGISYNYALGGYIKFLKHRKFGQEAHFRSFIFITPSI